jgi:hypothetical protein
MKRALNSFQSCPPGVFCISPGFFLLLGLLAAILLLVVRFPPALSSPFASTFEAKEKPIEVKLYQDSSPVLSDKYIRPPRPQRFWDAGPELPPRGGLIAPDGGYIFQEPTRGLPEQYQTMGVLKTDDGALLPLYGRRTAYRSDRFNYYTRTDTNNPVPLPITYKRKDCQDDIGCEELSNGDQISIAPTGQQASATLYRFDGPMYLPGLL